MRFRFEIAVDNAAFEVDRPTEVRKALVSAAVLVQSGRQSATVRDSNGNTVGEWSFVPDEDQTD